MKLYNQWFALLAVAAVLTGCARTAPVAQAYSSVSAGYSQEQVRDAILKAGVQQQWLMTEASPGVIKAHKQLRGQRAGIRILYSASRYAIANENGDPLSDASESVNDWVRNLDKDIQLDLSAGIGADL